MNLKPYDEKDKVLSYLLDKMDIDYFFVGANNQLLFKSHNGKIGQAIKRQNYFTMPVFIYSFEDHLLDRLLEISQRDYDIVFYDSYEVNGVLLANTSFESLAIEADLEQ